MYNHRSAYFETKRIEGKADSSMAFNIILAVERGLEQCMTYLAEFEGFDGGSVELEINKQLVADSVSTEEVKTALTAVLAGKMTDETFMKIVQRASFSPKDYDPVAELKQLEADALQTEKDAMDDLEPEPDEKDEENEDE